MRKNERGVVLIWAMLILTGLFASAATIATIMQSSLRIAGSLDASLPAFYAAESCLEEALFYMEKVTDTNPDGTTLTDSEKVDRLNTGAPRAPSLSGTLANEATWQRLADAVCVASSPPDPPDPCAQVFLKCIGSFRGTTTGISNLF